MRCIFFIESREAASGTLLKRLGESQALSKIAAISFGSRSAVQMCSGESQITCMIKVPSMMVQKMGLLKTPSKTFLSP